MSYTSLQTPLVILAGEEAIRNAIQLARSQWPALFNFASEAFFQSEWFLKKMDGQPYQPRLIVPICASPAVLEKAAGDPRYLAYPLPDLPLPKPGGQEMLLEEPGRIPICAQVDEVGIYFPPAAVGELPDGWTLKEGQLFVRLKVLLGMLAEPPGLPAIPEQPVLLLKFPIDLKTIISAGLVRGADGKTRLDVGLNALDLMDLAPLALKQMLHMVIGMAAERLLPDMLAKITCPIEIKPPEISAYPTGGAAPYHIEFLRPIQVTARIDARLNAQPNPEMKEDRLGAYFELELALKEGA